MQLTSSQHRLEHVPGIHRALGGTGTDDGMQFVDEQQVPAFGAGHFIQYGLEPLLKLTAILCAGHRGAHIQCENGLVTQPFRYIPVVDPLRQSFDDRGLADTWLADQHRVVLGFTRQDLDGPTDLRVPPDYWLQPPRSRLCYKITTVLAECLLRPLQRC